jgi:hypothetical protein
MGEGFIVRKGGVVSDTTAAPTITIVTETDTDVTFTLTNNDDNTAFITYEIDDDIAVIELAAAATSGNITVALAAGTYTLTAYATVVGEVVSQSTAAVEIVVIEFVLLYDSLTADDGDPISLPTTQIDITGLSIGKNDELRLVYTLNNNSTTFRVYSLFVNDNTTISNYSYQELSGSGSTIKAFRQNTPYFTFVSNIANKVSTGFVDIKVSNNDRYVGQSQFVRSIGSQSANIEQTNINLVSSFSVTSITKLSVVAEVANGIAAGSRIRLYKVNTGDA